MSGLDDHRKEIILGRKRELKDGQKRLCSTICEV